MKGRSVRCHFGFYGRKGLISSDDRGTEKRVWRHRRPFEVWAFQEYGMLQCLVTGEHLADFGS
jgi:hypothetical protein